MHEREDGTGSGTRRPGGRVRIGRLGDLVAHCRERARRRHAADAGAVAGRPFVVADNPPNNEQDHIAQCLGSLRRQRRPADLVVVMADNCTDDTVDRAIASGAVVVETVDNRHRKAGALNAALGEILGHLDRDDGVLVMDADTELDDSFLEHAGDRLWADDGVEPIGGVGGIFVGTRHLTDDVGRRSLVRHLQHNEYVRYARHLGRRRGRALVLTGTGSLFRADALAEVALARRQGRLPDEGGSASVYDTASLTEDNELTLSLKRLGYRTVSPKDCVVYTTLMPSPHRLVEQRRRWQRGALENLGSHGLRRCTAPYLLRQIGTYLGVLFLPLYVVTLTTTLVRFGSVDWLHPLWVTVAVAYLVEQAWSVRRGGWRSVGTSLAVLPELWHTVLLNSVYAVSLFGLVAGTGERWGRGVDERAVEQLAGNPNSLSGTHHGRRWSRVLLAVVSVIVVTGTVIVLPLLALSVAWTVIAVFVLAGFALTLIRLVPLPMA
jgi:biofilm PGA synthesis N-glycosyltransferase PgaC